MSSGSTLARYYIAVSDGDIALIVHRGLLRIAMASLLPMREESAFIGGRHNGGVVVLD